MQDWVDALDRVIEAFKKGDWADGLDGLVNLRRVFAVLTQDAYSFGKDLIKKDVMERAFNIASEIARQWRAGEFRSREDVLENVEQSCDSACTYTQFAQFVLAVSKHDDAYVEEHGELPHSNDSVPWAALATYALRRDVLDCLRREPGVDIDEDRPDTPLVDCGSCGSWAPGTGDTCDDCRAEEPE